MRTLKRTKQSGIFSSRAGGPSHRCVVYKTLAFKAPVPLTFPFNSSVNFNPPISGNPGAAAFGLVGISVAFNVRDKAGMFDGIPVGSPLSGMSHIGSSQVSSSRSDRRHPLSSCSKHL